MFPAFIFIRMGRPIDGKNCKKNHIVTLQKYNVENCVLKIILKKIHLYTKLIYKNVADPSITNER